MGPADEIGGPTTARSSAARMETVPRGQHSSGPMRWDDAVIRDFREHLAHVGLDRCPVCGSETLAIANGPVVVSRSGAAWMERGRPGYDSHANPLYMFMVECEFCGHVLLFNSERIDPADRPVLRLE